MRPYTTSHVSLRFDVSLLQVLQVDIKVRLLRTTCLFANRDVTVLEVDIRVHLKGKTRAAKHDRGAKIY